MLKVIASTLGSRIHIDVMRAWFKRDFDLCKTSDEDRFNDADPDCRHTMPRMAGLYVRKGLEIAEMRMRFVERFGDRVGKWVEGMMVQRVKDLRRAGLLDDDDVEDLQL